jgi:hypothetical protein
MKGNNACKCRLVPRDKQMRSKNLFFSPKRTLYAYMHAMSHFDFSAGKIELITNAGANGDRKRR